MIQQIIYLMLKNLSVLVLVIVCVVSDPNLYQKVIPNYDPEAKCLDGSPAFLYIHEGGDKKNFLIYFLGGGMCGAMTKEDTL